MSSDTQAKQDMAIERAGAIAKRQSKSRLRSTDIEYELGNTSHDRGAKTEMFICHDKLKDRELDR